MYVKIIYKGFLVIVLDLPYVPGRISCSCPGGSRRQLTSRHCTGYSSSTGGDDRRMALKAPPHMAATCVQATHDAYARRRNTDPNMQRIGRLV
jgi:hypothetical protein